MEGKTKILFSVLSLVITLGATQRSTPTEVSDIPSPTYLCHVTSLDSPKTALAGSAQAVSFQVTYDTTVQTDIALYLKDSVTREPIDIDTISANGQGEQTVTLQFTAPPTVGNGQMLYEVNYYSFTQRQEVSCENGAGFIDLNITEPPPVTNNTATTAEQAEPQKQNQTTVGSTAEASSQQSNWPIVLIAITTGLMVGTGLWYGHKKIFKKGPDDATKPVKPVAPKPGAPKKTYVCSCTVTIEAPSELPLCICWDSPMSFTFPGEESSKAFLDVNDLQKKKTYEFKATCTPHCAGQARNISYTWQLRNIPKPNKPISDYLKLECEASYDATLPDGTEVHVKCSAIKKIKLVQTSCQVNIIYVAGGGGDVGYGHVAMQIICGPNNVIYGYYSANNSLSGPGQVVSNDDLGENYENFYPDYRKTVYDIRHLNKWKQLDCHQCSRLVHFWKNLAGDPGQYGGDNTCTTRLADALEAIGLIDIKNFKKSFWGPVVGTNDMATSYPSQFISVLFEGYDPDAIVNPVK